MSNHAIDSMLDMVERFNREIIGLPIPGTPTMLSESRDEWAWTALREEIDEFAAAETLEDKADALIDLVYFALGRLVEMGLAPLPLFEQVHKANMEKKRGELSKRPNSLGYDAVKPEGWKPPDLQPYLTTNWKELYDRHRLVQALPILDSEKLTKGCYPGDWKDKPKTMKDTAGKAPLSRIPYEALVGEAEVFDFGSQKYAWDGFKVSPPSVHDLLSAIMRHAGQMANGQDLDLGPNGEYGPNDDPKLHMKWSGKPHWAHIRCCTSMLSWVLANRPDKDDRYGKQTTGT